MPFDVAPFRLSGTVYGTLLNYRDALVALGTSVHEAPYKSPPKSVVLYVKPRNTLAGSDDAVEVPADAAELEVGPSLGLVIGRTACRVSEAQALDHVAGCVIVADVSVSHASFYRPQVRFKAGDGFCPIGPRVVSLDALGDLGRLAIRVQVDGRMVHESSTAGWIRSPARLLAEVTDFMTLAPGDILMTGVPHGAPRVRAGQRSAIEIDGLGRLENRFVANAEAAS